MFCRTRCKMHAVSFVMLCRGCAGIRVPRWRNVSPEPSCKSVSISLAGEAVRASAVRTPAQFLDECRPQSFTSNQDPVSGCASQGFQSRSRLMLPSVVLGPVTTVIVNPVQATPVEAQLLLHLACMFTLLSVSDKNKCVYARHMFRRAAGQDGTMAEKPVWS